MTTYMPAGMVALDPTTVVRLSAIVTIVGEEHDDAPPTTRVVMSSGGDLVLDCDIEELLARLARQDSRNSATRAFLDS